MSKFNANEYMFYSIQTFNVLLEIIMLFSNLLDHDMYFLVDFTIKITNLQTLTFIFYKNKKKNIDEMLIKILNCIQSDTKINVNEIILKIVIFSKYFGHSIRFCNFSNLNLPTYFLKSESLSCFFDSLAYCILKYAEGNAKTFLNKKQIYKKAESIALSCKKSYNNAISINEISNINQYIDYNIIIFSFSNNPLDRVNTIYKTNKINFNKKTIYLLLHNFCYFPLKNPRYLIDKSGHESTRQTDYCLICNKFIKKINTHKCNKYCSICKTIECPKLESDRKYKVCSDCNRTFPSSACFKFHKSKGTCSREKICTVCCSKYKFNAHTCDISVCSVCQIKYKNDGLTEHLCTIKPRKLISQNKKI